VSDFPAAAMEVDTVLASLKERDKWRDRLTLLQQTLGAIRTRRVEFRRRLRTLEQELKRLPSYSDALLEREGRRLGGRNYGGSDSHQS
jgi:hypothetical protein